MPNGLHAADSAFLQKNVIDAFYATRLVCLAELQLAEVLRRKNPYLFKAKNILTAGDFAKAIVDAFLSSKEETDFGNLLEKFAIHVATRMYGGFKSARGSLDLEFQRDGKYYIVGIKSGTAWGNSDQQARMKDNFARARKELRATGIRTEIVAVNGCMYGRDNTPLKTNADDPDKTFYKYAGQRFWAFLTKDEGYYKTIIEPISKEAKHRDDDFKKAYAKTVNRLTADMLLNFVREGEIDWGMVVDYVSANSCNIVVKSAP